MDTLPSLLPRRRDQLILRGLAVAAMALAAVLPLGLATYWLAAPPDALANGSPLPPSAVADLDLAGRAGAAALSLVPMAILAWGLIRISRTFLAFSEGGMFSSRAIAGLRDFALAVAISALCKPLITALLGLYLTWNAGPGQRQLILQFGSDTLLFTLFGGTFLAATWAMQRAALLAEENRQFV